MVNLENYHEGMMFTVVCSSQAHFALLAFLGCAVIGESQDEEHHLMLKHK